MKNSRARAIDRTSPAKSGQRSLNPTPSNPRYPTLARRPVLLGVYGSEGSSSFVAMAVWDREGLPGGKAAQRPDGVDDPDADREPVDPGGNGGNADRPRGLLELVLLVLGAVGALRVL